MFFHFSICYTLRPFLTRRGWGNSFQYSVLRHKVYDFHLHGGCNLGSDFPYGKRCRFYSYSFCSYSFCKSNLFFVFIYTVFNFGTPIINQYALCHRRQDIESVINILNKKYGQNNPYSDHLLHSTHMIGNCCFLMTWENFDRMMKFMFDILEEFSIQESCYEDLGRWSSWAISNFGEGNYRYQMRVIGFLAERLISAFISTSLSFYIWFLFSVSLLFTFR